ncbi:MAG: helix-turn-helix transcriptional regulator [Prevotellaceae bacterium]|nr:helix-turn-helix transcriptional regulator [Prevotellaceae bacterium]
MTFIELYREALAKPIPPTPRDAFVDGVAAATGCSRDTVISWAIGRRKPSCKAKEAIGKAFGKDPKELFPD